MYDLLNEHTFPKTMEFQETKLSASGQDLGGSILFPLRLGFSGTPALAIRYCSFLNTRLGKGLLQIMYRTPQPPPPLMPRLFSQRRPQRHRAAVREPRLRDPGCGR